jgi:peptide/nickel transport system ATP-binding protein
MIEVEGLNVSFRTAGRAPVPVLSDVSFTLRSHRITGLVGESGSGKSVTALALMDLLPRNSAEVRIGVLRKGSDEIEAGKIGSRRGRELSMIFQEPMRSLNPAFTAGEQIAAVARRHLGLDRRAARAKAIEMLELVGIPDPERNTGAYPHQLSGGMCQRVLIAIALVGRPGVLFADEPTTALDATTQAQVLSVLRELTERLGMTTMIATHDLGVVAELCDDVLVMYSGEIVERASVVDLFRAPRHPYTKALLACSSVGQESLRGIPGSVPTPGNWPAGCRFAPRCSLAVAGVCDVAPVPLIDVPGDRSARCLRLDQTGGTR